jgi:hypothetical protein
MCHIQTLFILLYYMRCILCYMFTAETKVTNAWGKGWDCRIPFCFSDVFGMKEYIF